MHKLQFARGIGQREMLRANTLPSITRAKVGCFARLHIYEENARLILISLILIVYLICGAFLFNHLEWENEQKERKELDARLQSYRRKYCGNNTKACDFHDLIDLISEANSIGIFNSRSRFDLYGSLFFSGTVISTIGFGSSTPRTWVGRLCTIIYGLIGCTGCVLFFNLFLERFITLLSYFLRYLHEKKLRKRAAACSTDVKPVTLLLNNDYIDTASSCEDGGADPWRPSVYKVFFCIATICAITLIGPAMVYSFIESWPYVDSLYFCFTSFATIGFGDYVSNLKDVNMSTELYRFINFFLLTFGACIFYCLFNVSSIVVRQLLNWMIKKMDIKIESGTFCGRKKQRYYGLGLRPPRGYECPSSRCSMDATEGLLSLKEFLMNQQSSVLLLQRQLIASASKNIKEPEPPKISATRVGPMGILDEKFGDES
ncbi:unnamed protein product [Auanema sp. JU1783]|nr:unnamed protein product [Auanema sp. JU1783]